MRRVQYFCTLCILSASLVAQSVECAALTLTAWYAPITKSVGACASSYKTWRVVHPRLATTSDLFVLAGVLVWAFNRFMKPVNSHSQQVSSQGPRDSEALSFYPDDQKSDDPYLAPDKPEDGYNSDEELTRQVFNPPAL